MVPAEAVLEEREERLALLVGDIRHAVVGIVLAQVDGELLVRRIGVRELAAQRLHTEHVFHPSRGARRRAAQRSGARDRR